MTFCDSRRVRAYEEPFERDPSTPEYVTNELGMSWEWAFHMAFISPNNSSGDIRWHFHGFDHATHAVITIIETIFFINRQMSDLLRLLILNRNFSFPKWKF